MKEETVLRYQEANGKGEIVWVTVNCEYDFGDDLAGAIEKFGELTVYKYFRQAAVSRVRSAIKERKKAGYSLFEIQAHLNEMVIGSRSVPMTASAADTVIEEWDKLPQEKREEIIKLSKRKKK